MTLSSLLVCLDESAAQMLRDVLEELGIQVERCPDAARAVVRLAQDQMCIRDSLSINANAPYPGTPCYPNCPPPINNENLYQYVSEGVFRQNQLIVNTNIRVGTKLQLLSLIHI